MTRMWIPDQKTDWYDFSSDLTLSQSHVSRLHAGYYTPERTAKVMSHLVEQGMQVQMDTDIEDQRRIKIYAPNRSYGVEMFLGWPSRETYVAAQRRLFSYKSVAEIESSARVNTDISLSLVTRQRLDTGDGVGVHPPLPQDSAEFMEQLEFYRKTYELILVALYKEARVNPRVEITLRPPLRSEDKLKEMQGVEETIPLPRTAEQVVPEKLTLNDVKGQDSAVAECRRLVKAINEPEKYEQRGVKPPKGALLVGPPGTGKTMIARAIASEADADFIQINAANVGSKWINESAQKVNKIFDDAEKKVLEGRKVILFVDEMDAITISRENAHPEDVKTISIFLQRLDGLVESRGVTLLATTNRPDAMDPAILRPGRIDRIIEVPLPDPEGRTSILQAKSEAAVGKAQEGYKDLFEPNLDWKAVGSATDDFSGAELENLINIALAENLDLDQWKPVTAEQLLLLRGKVKKEYAQKQSMRAQEQRMSEFGFGAGGRMAQARAQAQSTL